ncbi:MAG: hypothetical protein LRY20_00365 [Acholeplasmataceae bacterium]|nr:hypothetical protein [Acholeplasmataceae bacterium]
MGKSYLIKQIQINDVIQMKGIYDLYRKQINASSLIKAEKRVEIKPTYGFEGLYDKTIMNIVSTIQEEKLVSIYENIPKVFVERYKLLPRQEALFKLHLPQDMKDIERAKRRMKYEEAFFLQLKLLGRRQKEISRLPKNYDIHAVKDVIQTLPYLTN